MSFVSAQPTELSWAAENLHAEACQAIHEMFVNLLGVSAGSYTATEAASAAAAG